MPDDPFANVAADLRRQKSGSDPDLGPPPDTDLDGDLERLASEASPNRRPSFGRAAKLKPPEPGMSPANRTPLPKELSLHAISADELIYLRNENTELRKLIEQAIAQESDFTAQLNQAG